MATNVFLIECITQKFENIILHIKSLMTSFTKFCIFCVYFIVLNCNPFYIVLYATTQGLCFSSDVADAKQTPSCAL